MIRTPPAFVLRRTGPRCLVGPLVAAGLLLVASLVGPDPATAQADSSRANLTVEAEYEMYADNISPKEARRQAIERAQAEAVRKAIGTQVQAERRSATIETRGEVVSRFSQVVRTGASGRVVDHTVLEEHRPERNGEIYQYVRIQATVRPTTGQPDRSFRISTLRLTDDDNAGTVDAGVLSRVRDGVADEVDIYLRRQYDLPIQDSQAQVS